MIDELTIYNLAIKYPNTVDLVREVERITKADAIEEFVKAFKDNMLKSKTPTWTCYVEEIAEQLKEQNK